MRTAGHAVELNSENKYASPQTGSEQSISDYMGGLERKLKALWSEYVEHQENFGFDERAKALKENYFSLYQAYRRNKNWKQVVSSNQSPET